MTITATRYRHELTVGGVKVIIQERRFESRRQYQAKTRVYGAFHALSPELDAELDEWLFPKSPAITEEFQRDNPEESARVMKGYRRAHRALVRATTARLEDLFYLVTFSDRALELKFSKTAGCSCGCSPGYVLSRTLRWNEGRPVDIYLSR